MGTAPAPGTSRPRRTAGPSAIGAVRKLPAENTTVTTPACIGVQPSPPWSRIAKIRKKPCMPRENRSWTRNPTENAGSRNARTGSSGTVPAPRRRAS
jgi:hypothetical protein